MATITVYGKTRDGSTTSQAPYRKYPVLVVFVPLLVLLTLMSGATTSYAQTASPQCPSAVSQLTAASRPDLALKFIDELRKGGTAMASICEPERQLALSAVATAKSNSDDACKAASTLIENKNPAAALDLIGRVRENTAPTEDAFSVFSSCEKERRQALVALNGQLPGDPSQGICGSVTGLVASGRPEAALALVETIRGPVESRTVQESGLCESERLAALKAKAEAEGGTNPAEKFGQNWDVLLRDWVAPVEGAASVVLALTLGFLVLARLFALMPLMPVRRLPWNHLSTSLRRASFILGLSLILLSSVLTTLHLSDAPFDQREIPALWGDLVVGISGSFFLAIFISSRLRLNLEVRGPDGNRNQWAEARIVAALTEMGSKPSRGIEVPRGVDLAGLDDAGVSLPFTNKVMNALQKGVKLVAGVTPWYVSVEVKSDDLLAFSITRNGWAVSSGTISRENLGLTKISGTDQSPELFKMVSAAIVATLAPHYEGFEGLCGATDWRSIGLHCMATIDYSASPAQAISLLAQAVALDQNNIAAQIAQQYYLHREAIRDDELKLYMDWLHNASVGLAKSFSTGGDGLILRTKMTYLACAMNLSALPEKQVSSIDRRQSVQQATRIVSALVEDLEQPAPEVKPLADEIMPIAALFYFDLKYPRISYSDLPTSSPVFEHYKQATLTATAPKVAYDAACSLATRDIVRSRPGESKAALKAREDAWNKKRITWIRERLNCATTDPQLRAWAYKDPEFEKLRLNPALKSLLSPPDEERQSLGRKAFARALAFLSTV